MTPVMPRGMRNNNPGNLDKGADWQGLVSPGTDPRFAEFTSMAYGIRAIGKILQAYELKDGLRTIRQIISRWAPPTENLTDSYVKAVSMACGIGPDAPFPLTITNMTHIVVAICHQENGGVVPTIADISAGMALLFPATKGLQ